MIRYLPPATVCVHRNGRDRLCYGYKDGHDCIITIEWTKVYANLHVYLNFLCTKPEALSVKACSRFSMVFTGMHILS